MKFPQDFIERVRDANNIVDVISPYVQLRRGGSNLQGICPFHNEKTPSFSVSEDKQVYYCFGCKASGNVITFVENYQGMTFPETIEFLAKRAAIPLPQSSEAPDPARESRNLMFRINALAATHYNSELMKLPADHEVRKYLETRGLNEELVTTYKIGFARDAWTDLAQLFAQKRVPTAPAEQLGLIKRRKESGHYDLFRHRLMFPIFSPTGDCLGFGGRVLSADQQPKYLNSPDSPVFHKGKVFYGLNHATKFIRNEDEAIVVEGYMDWLALAKVSISNVVATLGTALTNDHARLIKRYTNKVLLLFDGDNAGKAAARRSLPILLSEGISARGLFLPDELDPDEFIIERGAPALRQMIQSAPDLFDLVSTDQWLRAKGSPTGKIELIDEFVPILNLVQDARLRSLYVAGFANMVGVEIKMVENSLQRLTHPPRSVIKPVSQPTSQNPTEAARIDLSKAPKVESEILNVILMKEVYLKQALESAVDAQMLHPGCKAVFQRIAQVYGQMPNKFDTLSALLVGEVRPVETITKHLSEPYTNLKDEDAKKLLLDCIKRVKNNFLKSKSKELVSGLRSGSEANQSDQLEQFMNIHKNRKKLNGDS